MADDFCGKAPPPYRVDADLVQSAAATWQRAHVAPVMRGRHSTPSLDAKGKALKIIDYHGGSIWLDTDHRNGTRIRFTLPNSEEIQDA
jgi:hypothetical protein